MRFVAGLWIELEFFESQFCAGTRKAALYSPTALGLGDWSCKEIPLFRIFKNRRKATLFFREIFGIYYHGIWARCSGLHKILFTPSYNNLSVLSVSQEFYQMYKGSLPLSATWWAQSFIIFSPVTSIGKKLSDLERVTSLKVYNWFANRRKEIKRRANIGNVSESLLSRFST